MDTVKKSIVNINVVNLKNEPVEETDIVVEVNAQKIIQKTNEEGIAEFLDIEKNVKHTTSVYYQGKTYQGEFICQQDNETHTIEVGVKKRPFWLWLIPLTIRLRNFIVQLLFLES